MNNKTLFGTLGTVYYLHFEQALQSWHVLSAHNPIRAQPICSSAFAPAVPPSSSLSSRRLVSETSGPTALPDAIHKEETSSHVVAFPPEEDIVPLVHITTSDFERDHQDSRILRSADGIDQPFAEISPHVFDGGRVAGRGIAIGLTVTLIVFAAIMAVGHTYNTYTHAVKANADPLVGSKVLAKPRFMLDLKEAQDILRSMSSESGACGSGKITHRTTIDLNESQVTTGIMTEVTIESYGGMKTACLSDGSLIFRSSSSEEGHAELMGNMQRVASSDKQHFNISFRENSCDYTDDWLEAPISRSRSADGGRHPRWTDVPRTGFV